MSRILIAEDEARLAAFLEKGLQANGFATTVAGDGATALSLARDEDFDLLVLDLGLPALDGLSVLRTMREQGRRMPVVILSARDEVDDKVVGLEHGADDYLTKPFRFEELLARVRVRLRDAGTAEQTVLRAGEVGLDLRTRRAHVDGRAIELTRARVHHARGLPAPPGAGAQPRAAAGTRVGLRLRPRLERRRRLRRLPAAQARPRPHP